MMRPLRKRHLQIWIAFAVLIPAGVFFAWLTIPDSEPVKLLQSSTIELLPVVKSTNDKRDYTVNLRTNSENTEWQLEWKNKTPLTFPSAVIYKITGDGNDLTKNELVGRIEATGDYVFTLRPDSTGYTQLNLVLYDFIHQQNIDSINLHL